MAMLPTGIKGLVFAALVAAIIASLGSKINSIATIFTMDLYRAARPQTGQKKLVMIGRIVAVVAVVIGVLVTKPFLRQLRPGLPVHPGFHRLRHAGHLRDLPAGPVLGAHHGDGGHGGGAGHRGDVRGVLHLAARLSVHEPRRLVLRRGHGDRGRRSRWRRRRAQTALRVDIKNVDFTTGTGFNIAALVVVVILACLYYTWW